ncbi:MAG: membrane dipeptidase [Patescibacteria group bacterium]
MELIDPHIDIASIYDEFKIPIDDFFSQRKDIPVTLSMLKETEIRIVGFTLFMDPNLIQTNMFDGVMNYFEFYKELLSKTNELIQIKSRTEVEDLPSDKVGFFYSIEGLECLRDENDFETFYDIGVRSFGLTWEFANDYATGNGSKNDFGITNRGKALLKKMSNHRLIVDTAHLSDRSFVDLDKSFDGIIVNTHANAKAIVDLPHNLSDDQIQMIVDHDGLVCLLPTKDEVGGNGTFDDWYKHLDYIASKWGDDRVALCSDIFPLPEYPFVNNAQNMTVIKDFQNYLLKKLDKDVVQRISFDNFSNLLKRSLSI